MEVLLSATPQQTDDTVEYLQNDFRVKVYSQKKGDKIPLLDVAVILKINNDIEEYYERNNREIVYATKGMSELKRKFNHFLVGDHKKKLNLLEKNRIILFVLGRHFDVGEKFIPEELQTVVQKYNSSIKNIPRLLGYLKNLGCVNSKKIDNQSIWTFKGLTQELFDFYKENKLEISKSKLIRSNVIRRKGTGKKEELEVVEDIENLVTTKKDKTTEEIVQEIKKADVVIVKDTSTPPTTIEVLTKMIDDFQNHNVKILANIKNEFDDKIEGLTSIIKNLSTTIVANIKNEIDAKIEGLETKIEDKITNNLKNTIY